MISQRGESIFQIWYNKVMIKREGDSYEKESRRRQFA